MKRVANNVVDGGDDEVYSIECSASSVDVYVPVRADSSAMVDQRSIVHGKIKARFYNDMDSVLPGDSSDPVRNVFRNFDLVCELIMAVRSTTRQFATYQKRARLLFGTLRGVCKAFAFGAPGIAAYAEVWPLTGSIAQYLDQIYYTDYEPLAISSARPNLRLREHRQHIGRQFQRAASLFDYDLSRSRFGPRTDEMYLGIIARSNQCLVSYARAIVLPYAAMLSTEYWRSYQKRDTINTLYRMCYCHQFPDRCSEFPLLMEGLKASQAAQSLCVLPPWYNDEFGAGGGGGEVAVRGQNPVEAMFSDTDCDTLRCLAEIMSNSSSRPRNVVKVLVLD